MNTYTRLLWFAVVALVAVLGTEADAQAGIDAEREREEILTAALQRRAQLDDLERLLSVAVDERTGCPVERQDAALSSLTATCDAMARDAAATTKKGTKRAAQKRAAADACTQEVQESYARLLVARYSRADFQAVAAALRSAGPSADAECLLSASHNDAARAYVQALRAKDDALTQRQLATIDQIAAFSAAPPPPRPTPNAARALGALLNGVGDGLLGQDSAGADAVTPGADAPRSCSNDFACGIGSTCVKQNYSGLGVCLKTVNSYGVQQFNLPRLDSTNVKLPNARDCRYDTQCPIGFRCNQGSGACVK